MAKTINWLYARKGCATCKKAAGWCETAGIKTKETVDATKERYGPAEALALLDKVSKIIAAKGKNVVTIELGKKTRPTDEEITSVIIGPTGNLRAPTAIVGKTMLVGFHEEAYASVLG